MRQSFIPRAPRCYAHESARQTANVPPQRELGKDSGSVDSVLRVVVFKACGSTDPDAGWQERKKDIRADAAIVSMSPAELSLALLASLQRPLPFPPRKSLYRPSRSGG